ncbi:MAG: UDP-N-acetylglucosamine--LPS N-acetylglucosamine transferase [Verrucomicrobia bacterium]|nr:UDP-N-acetylglucosamine--LPS N-acetylglucosamine transferase [Verrucomicrobiota bacterium]
MTMRILILTSSTGGCHDMRARAFAEWAGAEPQLNLVVQMHRPLEESHWFYAFGVGLYNWIQRTAPALHHVYFNFLELASIIRTRTPLGAARFRAALEAARPDVVLSVHDSLNHTFFDYARAVLGRDRVRCVTYCDELSGGYGFSRHWVNPAADLLGGAVPETCQAAIRWGMAPEKTLVGGFVTRRSFYEPAPNAGERDAFIRGQLQLDPRKFILLLMASGRGAQNHVRLLEALKRARVDTQVVALCGDSPHAASAVAAWAQANPSLLVRVLPHDTDVGRLMRCVSAVVARPGAGVCSEAIVSHCSLLINSLGGLMPQELINVKFCRKHGLGEIIRRPDDLARRVARWKENAELPAGIRQRMAAACPPGGPREILRRFVALAPQSR